MEAKGKWRAPAGPTIASGGHLDFGIISRALSPVVKVALQWLTPFKPHAALVWELPLSEIRLHMPQARSFKPQPLQPQPFQPVASSQAPHVLGLRIPNSVMAQTFADLSCAVELSVFGNAQAEVCTYRWSVCHCKSKASLVQAGEAIIVPSGGALLRGWSPAKKAHKDGLLDPEWS